MMFLEDEDDLREMVKFLEFSAQEFMDPWQKKFIHAMFVLVGRWTYSDKQRDKIIEIYEMAESALEVDDE